MARATTAPPIAIDPVSPIKTEAGFVLKYKNPSNTANKIIENILVLSVVASKNKQMATGKLTLVASPSSPSVRFTAFVVPTIINTRIGKPRILTYKG